MRRIFLVLTTLVAASFLLVSCEPAASNTGNSTNKPANAANNAAANSTASSAAIEADLKKMTTDMAASLTKNDIAAMEKIYGENYMFVGPDGTVSTRAQRIEAMKTGDTKYESINYDDISVRSNPEGTGAIVISRVNVKGKNMGKAVDGLYRVTHIWSKTKDGWRMVNGQTTPMTATAAAPANTSTNTAGNTANSPANAANR